MNPPSRFRVFENPYSACARAADSLALLIRERAELDKPVVLGLVAGDTCLPFFKELIYRHREERLSLENVVVFATDEYAGHDGSHPASLRAFVRQHLFDHVDIPASQIHFPPATSSPAELEARCAGYDALIKRSGGIDFQILRLRQNGSIGIHDPEAPTHGGTQKLALHQAVREYRAGGFGGIANMPTHVVSLGYKTILKSRKINIFAWGPRKAYIVRRLTRGRFPPTALASQLTHHPKACFFIDTSSGRLIAGD